TANEYPAIRPSTTAQRSSGSRRSASGTSRRVPAASRLAAGPPLRGGGCRPATDIRISSPGEQAADLGRWRLYAEPFLCWRLSRYRAAALWGAVVAAEDVLVVE